MPAEGPVDRPTLARRGGPWAELEALLGEARSQATLRSMVQAAGGRILFGASSPATVDWPRRYLAPTYKFGVPSAFQCPAVDVVSCSQLHQRARGLLERLGRSRPAETYEGNPARRYALGPDRLALAYSRRAGVTFVDRTSRTVAFITTAQDERARFEAARLIREVLTKQLEERGLFVLHAGAVRVGGRGVAICGPKHAGKTTLVCAMSEHAGADFIANDRIYVGMERRGLRIHGWPMSVRIGVGTCLASPRLRRWMRPGQAFAYPQAGWDPASGISDEAARRLARGPQGPKLELIPSELSGALDTTVVDAADLCCVVLPRFDAAAPPVELVLVPDGDAAARVSAQLLTPADDSYPDWLELRRCGHEELAARGSRLAGRMAREARVVEARFSHAAAAAAALADWADPHVSAALFQGS
jgi:hypothetical protein